jgi:hypothetical protein
MKAHSAAQRPTAQRALDEWRSTVAPELRSQVARTDGSVLRRAPLATKDTNVLVASAASPRKVPTPRPRQKQAAFGGKNTDEAEN